MSMKFDKIVELCPPQVETACGPDVIPPSDERCSDPAFADEHPEICGENPPQLLLKPELASKCALESIQFKTFIRAQGQEHEVTQGVTYTSSDPGVVIIGGASGKATTVAAGIATITAQWQNMSAYAQVSVLGSSTCCDDVKVGMVLLLDASKSMSQTFGGAWSTKLVYAKALARRFASEVNTTKGDRVAVMSFSSTGKLEAAMGQDLLLADSAIQGIMQTQEKTNLEDGIKDAIEYLGTISGLDKKVIVLLTDGEYNVGANPLTISEEFQSMGGVMVVAGIRAHTVHFTRLEKMASGGMFINAKPDNAVSAFDWLSGLKGYFCAGNCKPPGGTNDSTPELNYVDFKNWDVTGWVDLIGQGQAITLFDFLPGNGMYLDMVGSSAPWLGKITTKPSISIPVVSGRNYRLSYYLAGNQRHNSTGWVVRIVVSRASDGTAIFVSDRTLNDWLQPFTLYSDEFTAPDTGDIRISIEQLNALNGGASSFGNLLDRVRFEEVGGLLYFYDDFDLENITFTPPCSGYGCYGVGCLDSPIPAQTPDSPPLPDIEGTAPPLLPSKFFNATKCYTANCPVGTTGPSVTKCASYTSYISQEDADNRALQQAKADAEAALVCEQPLPVGGLINIDFTLDSPPSPKKGKAAMGATDEDFWNVGTPDNLNTLKNHLGQPTTVKLQFLGPGWVSSGGDLNHGDRMYRSWQQFLENNAAFEVPWYLSGLPSGNYQFLLYGHGPANDRFGKYLVQVGSISGGLFTPSLDYGIRETVNGPSYLNVTWQDGIQYVQYSASVIVAGEVLLFKVLKNGQVPNQAIINGLQILRLSDVPGGPVGSAIVEEDGDRIVSEALFYIVLE